MPKGTTFFFDNLILFSQDIRNKRYSEILKKKSKIEKIEKDTF